MLEIRSSGDFKKTTDWLQDLTRGDQYKLLDQFGAEGVAALSAATPKDTSETANSWYYEVTRTRGGAELTFYNRNVVGGSPIAVLLQYGHGTGTGGYVPGRDYINPALKPIFDKAADSVWKVVTK